MSIKPDRSKRIVIWIVATALFMELLDSTVLNTVLPPIARSLHSNPIDLKIALTSYLLSVGIFIPMSGWLADKLGPAQCMQLAICLFCFGSLGCALSNSVSMLVIFRIVQGIGGAFMTPTGRNVMIRVFGRDGIVLAMSKISAIAMLGPLFGPIVGGAFATYLSWRLIFLINIPIGLAGIWFIKKHFPTLEANTPKPFDFFGFILFGAALSGLLYVLDVAVSSTISSWFKFEILTAAIIFGILYARHSRKTPHPLLNGKLFTVPDFRYYNIGSFMMRLALSSITFLIPLFLQTVHGFSAFGAGLALVLVVTGALISKRIITYIDRRFDNKTTIIYATLTAVFNTSLMTWFTYHYHLTGLCITLLISGFLASTLYTLVNSCNYRALDDSSTSQGSTICSMNMQVSMSFGIALAGVILVVVIGQANLSHHLPAKAFNCALIVQTVILALTTLWFVHARRKTQALV